MEFCLAGMTMLYCDLRVLAKIQQQTCRSSWPKIAFHLLKSVSTAFD